MAHQESQRTSWPGVTLALCLSLAASGSGAGAAEPGRALVKSLAGESTDSSFQQRCASFEEHVEDSRASRMGDAGGRPAFLVLTRVIQPQPEGESQGSFARAHRCP